MSFTWRALKVPPNSARLKEARARVFRFSKTPCRSLPSIVETYSLRDICTVSDLRFTIFASQIHKNAHIQDTKYLCSKRRPINIQSRTFSSFKSKDELSIEEEAEKKIGWMLKLFYAGTAGVVAYQFFPYMGDNLIQQSVSLLQVKDPLFKRMGASRIARFAIDDERRKKILEMGGVEELVNMLGTAKDDKTRKEALKALAALSHSDEAVGALFHAGAATIISYPDSSEDPDINRYKSTLMKRFQDMRYDLKSGQ